MSVVSANIKFLRKQFRYTQEQLAEKIGIKRSLLGAYEEGRADPRLNNLLNIAKIFDVTVDDLISGDIAGAEPKARKQASAPDAKMKVLAITVDKDNNENIELVPQKAAAGYLNGYADPEYLEDLPKFKLPTLASGGTYRAFEISGDSMLPLEPGTIIIGRYVERADDIRNGKTYALLTKREGIVYKRVYNFAKESGKLRLVSDNKAYAPYEIEAEDALEIWEAKAYISLKLPGPQEDKNDGMSIDQLTSIVMNLQKEVARLRDK